LAKEDKNKVKTALFLTPTQVKALKDLQLSFPGINMSEHIRRAIDLYLEQMKKVAKLMPDLPGAPKERK
jgi:hypothetical protein